ncbi:MAG: prepilin-type N-terminal cleavage/methylation domain-containing protein [Candidatus Gracilibacteria bacterium]
MLKKLKQIFENKGVTLVEVLVAASLFAVATVVAGDILVSDVQLEKKTNLQNTLAAEMRIILQQISSEIQDGTIDYDEYYSICVLNEGCELNKPAGSAFYGMFQGVYGSRFYDPGRSLDGNDTNNPEDIGAECSYPNPQNGKECEVVYNLSVDLNTGQNPFTGSADAASAFCEAGKGLCAPPQMNSGSVTVDQLFILDKTGTKKTIIAKKKIRDFSGGADYALGKVVMKGKDYDRNGVTDIFSCEEGYNCYGDVGDQADLLAQLIPFKSLTKNDANFIKLNKITLPWGEDLGKPFEGSASETMFVPITPLFASIKDIKFIIHPIEDPYKAYAEPNMKGQPSVTIMLTVGLSSVSVKDYPGVFPDITLQTTVAAGVTSRIDSYPPVVEVKDSGTGSWLKTEVNGPKTLNAVP